MSTTGRILSERHEEGRVVELIIDRPPVNAVTPELIEGFLEMVDRISVDDRARVVLVRGAGGRFCAGADLEVMKDLERFNYRRMRRWVDVQNALEAMGKVVVAAIQRYALGGGAELALAADYRVMGDCAHFGFPEIEVGLFPGAGGTQRLTRLLGPARSFALMSRGTRLNGRAALEMGLVNEVVPEEDVVTRALQVAKDYAEMSPAALALLKRAVYQGWAGRIVEGLAVEEEAVWDLIARPETKEQIQRSRQK
jgi:enoyl-CoA hydratase